MGSMVSNSIIEVSSRNETSNGAILCQLDWWKVQVFWKIPPFLMDDPRSEHFPVTSAPSGVPSKTL